MCSLTTHEPQPTGRMTTLARSPRVVISVIALIAACSAATGCVSTGSLHAAIGKRGVEAPRLSGPTATASPRTTVDASSSVRLASAAAD